MNKEQLSLLLRISFAIEGYEENVDEKMICESLEKDNYIKFKSVKSSYQENKKLVSNSVFIVTEKGEELIKALLITSNFFETQHSIKKDAEDLLVKAKDKYNSLLDNLKI